MANTRSGNVIYIDSTGTASEEASVLIAYIVFNPPAGGGTVELRDLGGSSSKIYLTATSNSDPLQFNFARVPLVFQGITVTTLTAGGKVMLVKSTNARIL